MFKKVEINKYLISTLIIFSVVFEINAQLQNANWYFGNQAGLHFSETDQAPNALTDGVMTTDGGSASISDSDGNLLFYSDGVIVWGDNHKPIKNGTGLYGNSNVSQSVLIIPNPEKENEYYIFSNQAQKFGSLGLHYSVVKLVEKDDDDDNDDDDNDDDDDDDNYPYCNSKQTKVSVCHKGKNTLCISINALQAHLDHGDSLGSCDDGNDNDDNDNNNNEDDETEYAVVNKNIPLLPSASEKLTAVYNQNDNSYWVISFAPNNDITHNDTFYSFKVDSNGVQLITKSTFSFLPMNSQNQGGQMKISSDRQNLGLVHNTLKIGRDGGLDGVENIFTFAFNSETGSISSRNTHSILKNQSNGLELVSSYNGFDIIHSLLNGVKESTNIVASAYGFEFSPDGDKFYISTKEDIDYNTSVLRSSFDVLQVLYKNTQNYSANTKRIREIGNDHSNQVFSLQLGLDNKIYSTHNTENLDRIANPNELGQNTSYENNAISLNGKMAAKGLPQLIKSNQDSNDTKNVISNKSVVIANPFTDQLNIDLINTQSVKFYNQQGVIVKSVFNNDLNDSKTFSVDTSNLKIGIYFLVVVNDQDQIWHETVIKI